jgi:isopentenyl diphosphate isomerase/L-lactate dehydrogenase-like FMN-dependent dehydrogenase
MGVEHVLRCLLAELDLTLALSGYTSVDQIERWPISDRSVSARA